MDGASVGTAPDDGPRHLSRLEHPEPEQLEAPPPEKSALVEEVYGTPAESGSELS